MAKTVSASAFVAFLKEQVREKAGYIMASYGENPRTGYLDLSVPDSKCKPAWLPTGWYYAQYTNAKQHEKALYWRRTSKRVFDCQGLSEGFYELQTGTCVNTQARYNYANWCDPKGSGLIPAQYRVPGAAVFWGENASSIHHVAYLVEPVNASNPGGDWYIIEARGVMYGVVQTRLYERRPNFWGLMTRYFDYSLLGANPSGPAFGSRNLRNGSEGEDVRELQSDLIRLGYDCGRWGADGDFGDATEMAVRAFQAHEHLETDGIVGPLTFAALEKALVALEKPQERPRTVEIVGGSCYVRSAPNTSGAILGAAIAGTKLAYGGERTDDGWLLVDWKNKNGWVSGKYGKLVKG